MSLSQPSSKVFFHRPRVAMPKVSHRVPCPLCRHEFDLFAATWCSHLDGEPSKLCPSCQQCLCEHPAYLEPNFWKDAPLAFRQQGFQRLFLFYL
jgi:hypothetical protein